MNNYSNDARNVINEAKDMARDGGHVEVHVTHVIAAAMKNSDVVTAFNDVGVKESALKKAIQEDLDNLPKISQAVIAQYNRAGVQRKARNNIVLATALERVDGISENVWPTGEVELSHLMLAFLAVGSNILSSTLKTSDQKNKFVNSLMKAEAARLGIPCPQASFRFVGEQSQEESEFSKYYYDMLERAKNDDKPFVGREREIADLMNCLERKDKPNAILTGAPGVGKTDIVRGLAKKVVAGDVPEQLKDISLYLVDIPGMLAGSQFRGQFEERLKGTINELIQKDRPVLFIDEIHTVLGAGAVSGGSMDAANILKPYLTDGKIRVVGATTEEEYRRYVENDAAFMRRFQNIGVSEPSAKDAINILKGIKPAYESFHNVKFPVAAVETAVNLSVRHMHDRYLPDKAIDIMDQTCARIKLRGDKKVTVDDVEETVSHLCHIPKQNMQKDELAKVRNLDKKIKEQVFGQDHAIEKLTEVVQQSKVGLNDETKPIGSFLFVGPSGVGKTEIAKQLAQQLGIEFIRFDMSEYMESHSVAKLIGSPAGYVGYEDGGILVEKIRQHPHAVVLFDEIEKAHPDIFKIFLQIFDYGMLTDNKGRKADFRNTIIIMTSNAGNSVVEKHVGFNQVTRSVADKANEAISKLMPTELRGRLNDIVSFNPLSEQVSRLIVQKDLKILTARLKAKGITVAYTDAAIDEIVKRGVSAQYGAREIQNVIDKDIKPMFTKQLISGKMDSNSTVDFDGSKFVINKTVVVDMTSFATVPANN